MKFRHIFIYFEKYDIFKMPILDTEVAFLNNVLKLKRDNNYNNNIENDLSVA